MRGDVKPKLRRSMLRWYLVKRGGLTRSEACAKFGYPSADRLCRDIKALRDEGLDIQTSWHTHYDSGYYYKEALYKLRGDDAVAGQ